MAGGGSVTCVYTNTQQRGAIQITKTRKHVADGPGDHPHAGVTFTVKDASNATVATGQTDAEGIACFDDLGVRRLHRDRDGAGRLRVG